MKPRHDFYLDHLRRQVESDCVHARAALKEVGLLDHYNQWVPQLEQKTDSSSSRRKRKPPTCAPESHLSNWWRTRP